MLPERFDAPLPASTISLSLWSVGEANKVREVDSASCLELHIFPVWASLGPCGRLELPCSPILPEFDWSNLPKKVLKSDTFTERSKFELQ